MNRKRLPGMFLCAALLSGCATLAPRYERPSAPVPGEWPGEAAGANGSAAPHAVAAADMAWSDFFTDARQRQVIEQALAHNRDLRVAVLNVDRARALYGVRRAELLPAVNATGAGSRERSSADLVSPGGDRTSERYEVNLGVASWEIDLFGRIRSLKRQALQQYLATDRARRGAQLALVSEVAIAYLTLAADREGLRLAESTLETQRAAYDLVLRRHEASLAGAIDLRRASTQVDAARVDAAQYRQRVAQARNALELLAGGPVADDLLPDDLAGVRPPRPIMAGLPSETLLRRPDIMAAEHQLRAAYALIGAARAAFFPRIGLTAAVGTASDELSNLFASGTGTWSFSPQVTMPIFDARTWAAHRVGRAERDLALARYEKAVQEAFREVADVLAVSRTVGEQVAAQQSLVASAREIHELADRRYRNGIDSYLGVLDAQRTLYAARRASVALRLVEMANKVRLYAVLGGGVGSVHDR